MSPRPESRGFTLMEALVALVLTALAAVLLSQALFQSARLEQRLAEERLRAPLAELHASWAQQWFEGLLPVRPDQAPALRGNDRELEAASSLALRAERQGPQRLRWRLRFDPGVGMSGLMLDGDGMEAVTLMRWPGDGARFRYEDGEGQWQSVWPPEGASQDAAARGVELPRRLGVQDAQGRWRLLATPLGQGAAMSRRIDIDKMP